MTNRAAAGAIAQLLARSAEMLLALASSAPSFMTAALFARFVLWPSLTCTGLFLGLLVWKQETLLFSLADELLPHARWLAVAIPGSVVAIFGIRFSGLFAIWGTCIQHQSGPGRPLLFPSRTTHSRIFPKKHSFSYSYLVVGIPVGWSGTCGSLISADLPSSLSWMPWLFPGLATVKGWYNVDAADYLERGNGHLGLRGKLDAYLASLGHDPRAFPKAYLLTAAKFLGHHFNPVSFWYLYGQNNELAAMVLEVNNTFDERRMYYLRPAAPDDDGQATHPDSVPIKPLMRFKQAWAKDFHVSPFNSRNGSYTLDAHDVLAPGTQGAGNIDITIVLQSSKTHAKLVAKLFSDGPAIDPTQLGFRQRLAFVARWWWVGFVTFPRIVKEAGVLFLGKKLHVWTRPEPLKESIGRKADKTERDLEFVFRRYLGRLVEQCESALVVKYVPAGISDTPFELMLSPSAAKPRPPTVDVLELKVLTPVFYSRFVYYPLDLEALYYELRVNNTIWLSKPELLHELAVRRPLPRIGLMGPLDSILFKAIQKLRRRPEPIGPPSNHGQMAYAEARRTRGSRIAPIDVFVLSSMNRAMRSLYLSSVLKLFIADWTALGFMPVLEAQLLVLRIAATWLIASHLDFIIKFNLDVAFYLSCVT